jgi:serine/threonine-protein kinase RsbW
VHVATRRFSNEVGELRCLNDWLDEYASNGHIPSEIRSRVEGCLYEAVANVILHGYESGSHGTIAVSLETFDGGLRVTLDDDGRPFDPVPHPPPPIARTILDAPIGGFGIHLMRSMADGLEYRRERDHNILVMNFRERRLS